MGFELFTDYGAASRDDATLRVSGYLFLPNVILARNNCRDLENVQLYVDRENYQIGIKACTGADSLLGDGVKKVSVEKSGAAVNVMPILKLFGIGKPREKVQLPVKLENGLMIVDLGALALGL